MNYQIRKATRLCSMRNQKGGNIKGYEASLEEKRREQEWTKGKQ